MEAIRKKIAELEERIVKLEGLPESSPTTTLKDISIKELAYLIKDIVGFKGKLYFNSNKPDGTMKKLTNPSKLHALGWKHKVELEDGIKTMYEWYLK